MSTMMVMRSTRFPYVMDCCCRFLLRLRCVSGWHCWLWGKTCLRCTTTNIFIVLTHNRAESGGGVCLWWSKERKCEMCLRHKTFLPAQGQGQCFLSSLSFYFFLHNSLRVCKEEKKIGLSCFSSYESFFPHRMPCLLLSWPSKSENTEVAHAIFSFF